ncbi:MAG: NUDIX hydrolase [Victivallaceae bacterium]|nr:NUDIX hydrolase [Victivallaceae bacterium]
MKKKPAITAKKVLCQGKWLSISELKWQDSQGRGRVWESCDRVAAGGAVMIIAVIKPGDELILVKQFRPPAAKFVIEFPAGLIDRDESVAVTAARELYEETGYHGEIVNISAPVYSSPGMSGETLTLVTMEVDAECFSAGPPESFQEDSEDIETFLVKRAELKTFLKAQAEAGHGIDTKLWTYAAALAAGSR